jgi:DNA-binding transcriptional regulator YhcF (GntR family)
MQTDIQQNSDERKYMQVAEDLGRRIVAREFSGRLPGVRRLAEQYGVDPRTVCRAYDVLASQKLLSRKARKGVFVSSIKNCSFNRCVYISDARRLAEGDPFLAELTRKCRSLMWELVVVSHDDDPAIAAEIIRTQIEGPVPCGLMIQPLSSLDHAELIDIIGRSRTPAVWLRHHSDRQLRSVSDDVKNAAESITEQLLSEGVADISCGVSRADSPLELLLSTDWQRGYAQAMARAGRPPESVSRVEELSGAEVYLTRNLSDCMDALSSARAAQVVYYGHFSGKRPERLRVFSPSMRECVDAAVESLASTLSMNYTVRITAMD